VIWKNAAAVFQRAVLLTRPSSFDQHGSICPIIGPECIAKTKRAGSSTKANASTVGGICNFTLQILGVRGRILEDCAFAEPLPNFHGMDQGRCPMSVNICRTVADSDWLEAIYPGLYRDGFVSLQFFNHSISVELYETFRQEAESNG
jgi:hypothetical protein